MKHRENILSYILTFVAGSVLMFSVFIVCSEEMALFEGDLVCHGIYEQRTS